MHKLLLSVLTVAVIALASSHAIAQQKPTPEKAALIKELLEVTGSTKGVQEVADMMMSFQQAEAEKMISSMVDDDKTFTAEEKTQLKERTIDGLKRMTVRLNEFFVKEIDLGKAMDEIAVPLYDRNFTEAELRDLIAFYRSSTGQKTISVMPKLMMESMMGVSEKILPRLQEFLKRVTNEEFAELKQKAEQDKKTPPKPKARS